MFWIILTCLFAIVGWSFIGYGMTRETPEGKVGSFAAAGLVGVVWIGVSLFFMANLVGQRQVGIVYNFSGTITGKVDPGVAWTKPWEHVKKENVGIRHDEWIFGEGNSAVSLDQQPIYGRLSVNYQIDAANVVDLYKRVGASWKTIIIDARVPQVFKETTATYATPDITARREQLRIDTKARLTEELAPYDIKVVDVFVTNLGFSKSYTDSIEAKQKQVQDALREQAKVKQSEAIARQKVAEAEGEAKANVARARGEATANRLRQRSLTPRLVQWEAIQKLNPDVQMIVCPPNSVCVPNTYIPTGNGATP